MQCRGSNVDIFPRGGFAVAAVAPEDQALAAQIAGLEDASRLPALAAEFAAATDEARRDRLARALNALTTLQGAGRNDALTIEAFLAAALDDDEKRSWGTVDAASKGAPLPPSAAGAPPVAASTASESKEKSKDEAYEEVVKRVEAAADTVESTVSTLKSTRELGDASEMAAESDLHDFRASGRYRPQHRQGTPPGDFTGLNYEGGVTLAASDSGLGAFTWHNIQTRSGWGGGADLGVGGGISPNGGAAGDLYFGYYKDWVRDDNQFGVMDSSANYGTYTLQKGRQIGWTSSYTYFGGEAGVSFISGGVLGNETIGGPTAGVHFGWHLPPDWGQATRSIGPIRHGWCLELRAGALYMRTPGGYGDAVIKRGLFAMNAGIRFDMYGGWAVFGLGVGWSKAADAAFLGRI